MLPKTAAFTNFTKNGENSYSVSNFNINSGTYNRGWNFYKIGSTGETIFFEAIGFRDTYSSPGTIIRVGLGSLYWSAGASDLSYSYALNMHEGYVYPYDKAYRSSVFSIRAAKE